MPLCLWVIWTLYLFNKKSFTKSAFSHNLILSNKMSKSLPTLRLIDLKWASVKCGIKWGKRVRDMMNNTEVTAELWPAQSELWVFFSFLFFSGHKTGQFRLKGGKGGQNWKLKCLVPLSMLAFHHGSKMRGILALFFIDLPLPAQC